MSLKELFGKGSSPGAISHVNVDDSGVESFDFLIEAKKTNNRIVPSVDFSKPEQFARYGSAKKYYHEAAYNIQNFYPYDGSGAERLAWKNSNSFITNWIFDNEYPKAFGHAVFSPSSWGTQVSTSDGYGRPSSMEYIKFFGGPNVDNLFNVDNGQASNLELNGENGNTVEMWLKMDGSLTSLTNRMVLFDAHNGKSTSDAEYGRMTIEVKLGATPTFQMTYLSGTSGVNKADLETGLTNSDISEWAHYAFRVKNSGSNLSLNLFLNGVDRGAIITGSSVGLITGTMVGAIGSLVYAAKGSSADLGWGKLSGSVDDFRFWKTSRTDKQIGTCFTQHVFGGTNGNTANTDLGIYYKFNEGITAIEDVDSVVLDYSGRVSNGSWVGYESDSRSLESAIESQASFEQADPIIYSFHPTVEEYTNSLQELGEYHDQNNPYCLFNTIPDWLKEEDQGNLENILHIMGIELDHAWLQSKTIQDLKNVTYSQSGSIPPEFLNRALENAGFKIGGILGAASLSNEYASSEGSLSFEKSVNDVRQHIYRNIYNNLTDIQKSKGTERSVRNLVRCFGVDDELVKLNIYSNDEVYIIGDDRYQTNRRKNFADFSTVNQQAVIYSDLDSSNSNSVSFISGSQTGLVEAGLAKTYLVNFRAPKQLAQNDPNYVGFSANTLSSSIAGCASLVGTTLHDTTWASGSSTTMFVVREEASSGRAKFVLSGSSGFYCETHVTNVYDASDWTAAYTIKPLKNKATRTSGSFVLGADAYQVLFHVMKNQHGDIVETLTSSTTIPAARVRRELADPMGVYVGATRTNFTGSLLFPSDLKIGVFECHFGDMTNAEIQSRAQDPLSRGFRDVLSGEGTYLTGSSTEWLPRAKATAFRWDFEKDITSTSFYVPDASGGSIKDAASSGIKAYVSKEVTGKGYGWTGNVLDKEYIDVKRPQLLENLHESDTVTVQEFKDNRFPKGSKPKNRFYSVEMSMNAIVSEEMMNMVSAASDFSNIIGQPVESYRTTYGGLNKLRQMFFENIQNAPDYDKFLEYYKWIDDAISQSVSSLFPASSNSSEDIRSIVESTVLERNKLTFRYPLLASRKQEPVAHLDKSISSNGYVLDNVSASIVTTTTDYNQIQATQTSSRPVKLKKQNYFKTYDNVFLAGRKDNNGSFIHNGGVPSSSAATSSVIYGHVAFQLSNRDTIGNTIVSQFAAPGGPEVSSRGFLDREAEEFSPYNALPYRNLSVREPLNNILLTNHMLQGGYDGQKGAPSASFHKTDRNAKVGYKYDGTALSATLIYDNAWKQEAIPSNPNGYAWITSSVSSSNGTTVGYFQSASYGAYYNGTNMVFGTSNSGSSRYLPVDFVGLNTIIYEPLTSSSNTIGYQLNPSASVNTIMNPGTMTADGPTVSFNSIMAHRGNNFGHTWKTIRGAFNKLKAAHNSSSIISIKEKDLNGRESVTNYIEPFISDRSKPTEVEIDIDGQKVHMVQDISISREHFANEELNSKLGVIQDPFETKDSLVEYLGKVTYKQKIYPAAKNQYLNRTRKKTGFRFYSWRDARGNRQAETSSYVSYAGAPIFTASIWPLDSNVYVTADGDTRYNQYSEMSGSGELLTTTKRQSTYSSSFCYTRNPGAYLDLALGTFSDFPFGRSLWSVKDQSGYGPYYDSYDDFHEDIRLLGPGMSQVPEFRLSDNYSASFNDNAGNFLAESSFVLGITGTTSAGLYDNFVVSDLYQGEQKSFTKLRLKANAVLKFNPYNGFYPVERTLQLGKLFSSSIAPYVNLSGTQPHVITVLRPFYAPGIMYNTIKAGVACGYTFVMSGTHYGVSPKYTIGLNTTTYGSNFEVDASEEVLYNLPFEAIYKPVQYLSKLNGTYNMPDFEPIAAYNRDSTGSFKFRFITKTDSNYVESLPEYESAAKNFVSEVSRFWLKDEKNTTFISKEEEDFNIMYANKTYEMYVTMAKSDGFYNYNCQSVMKFGPWLTNGIKHFNPNVPSVLLDREMNSFELTFLDSLPSIDTYNIKISFTPTDTRKYTIQEILDGATVTSTLPNGLSGEYSMSLSSSLNVFEIINMPSQTRDDSGRYSFDNQTTKKRWKISTKFETPNLNFSGSVGSFQPDTSNISNLNDYRNGMWHTYGRLPKGEEGLFLVVADTNTTNESLADVLGFDKGMRRIGEIEKKKELFEAVIAIPFRIDPATSERQFFAIDRNSDSVSIKEQKEKMKKYLIPPRFDFIKFPQVDSIAMFIFEFSKSMNDTDLSHLWQNILPPSGIRAEKQTAIIEHDLVDGELLNNYSKDTKWMLFKVKQRAKLNLVESEELVPQFDFELDRKPYDYTYNWPYDYFSLVEVAELELELEYDSKINKVDLNDRDHKVELNNV